MISQGEFYEHVLKLCMKHNGSITSGYRTEQRNRIFGGAVRSWHKLGYGFDIVLDDMSDELKQAFRKDCEQLGFDSLDETDHIHVEVS